MNGIFRIFIFQRLMSSCLWNCFSVARVSTVCIYTVTLCNQNYLKPTRFVTPGSPVLIFIFALQIVKRNELGKCQPEHNIIIPQAGWVRVTLNTSLGITIPKGDMVMVNSTHFRQIDYL